MLNLYLVQEHSQKDDKISMFNENLLCTVLFEVLLSLAHLMATATHRDSFNHHHLEAMRHRD